MKKKNMKNGLAQKDGQQIKEKKEQRRSPREPVKGSLREVVSMGSRVLNSKSKKIVGWGKWGGWGVLKGLKKKACHLLGRGNERQGKGVKRN